VYNTNPSRFVIRTKCVPDLATISIPALPGSVVRYDFACREFGAIQSPRDLAQLHEARAPLLERADQRGESSRAGSSFGLGVIVCTLSASGLHKPR